MEASSDDVFTAPIFVFASAGVGAGDCAGALAISARGDVAGGARCFDVGVDVAGNVLSADRAASATSSAAVCWCCALTVVLADFMPCFTGVLAAAALLAANEATFAAAPLPHGDDGREGARGGRDGIDADGEKCA